MTEDVKVELIRSNFLRRYPCHVCGGATEKNYFLAQVTSGEYKGLRVCGECIEGRGFDARLQTRISQLRALADTLAEVIGRLDVPTFAAFQKANADADAEWEAEYREDQKRRARLHGASLNKVPRDF